MKSLRNKPVPKKKPVEKVVPRKFTVEKVVPVKKGDKEIVPQEKAVALIQTVCKNMEGFTKHEVREANLACKAQAILGHPSDREFAEMVSGPSGISNVPARPSSITNANLIHGKDLGGLRGKQVRLRPERACEDNLVEVPCDFIRSTVL